MPKVLAKFTVVAKYNATYKYKRITLLKAICTKYAAVKVLPFQMKLKSGKVCLPPVYTCRTDETL